MIANRLKEKRERADYDRFYPRIAEEVQALIGDAQQFAVELGALQARFPDPAHVRQ